MSKVDPFPIHTRSDFKAWCLQEPNARTLLVEIINRWRGASAKVRGKPGSWAAFSRQDWASWANLSLRKVDRALAVLELDCLIVREPHRWGGIIVRAFIQPTELALSYSGRPGDIARLAPTETTEVGKPAGKTPGNGDGKPNGKTGGNTDYTSLPFNPHSSFIPKYPKEEKLDFCGKKKGSVSIEDTANAASSPPPKAPPPQSPPPPKPKYPKLYGAHEKHVWHPSEKYPGWSTWSSELKAQAQAQYDEYVANWYKGKKGKPHALESDCSDEEWAKTQAVIAAMTLDV